MAIRIKWDKYETALLIDLFWRIKAHPEQRGELISNLSQILRKNAINNGYIIDDLRVKSSHSSLSGNLPG